MHLKRSFCRCSTSASVDNDASREDEVAEGRSQRDDNRKLGHSEPEDEYDDCDEALKLGDSELEDGYDDCDEALLEDQINETTQVIATV